MKLRKKFGRKLNNIHIQQKISSYNDTSYNKLIAADDYLLIEKLIDERKGRLGQLMIIFGKCLFLHYAIARHDFPGFINLCIQLCVMNILGKYHQTHKPKDI